MLGVPLQSWCFHCMMAGWCCVLRLNAGRQSSEPVCILGRSIQKWQIVISWQGPRKIVEAPNNPLPLYGGWCDMFVQICTRRQWPRVLWKRRRWARPIRLIGNTSTSSFPGLLSSRSGDAVRPCGRSLRLSQRCLFAIILNAHTYPTWWWRNPQRAKRHRRRHMSDLNACHLV